MPATKAEIRAYTRKLREIERRFGTLERGTMRRSIDLLKQLRANIAGEITQLSDFEQFRILQTRANLDAMITQYQGQLTGLSNGAVRQSYNLGTSSVVAPLEELNLANVFFQPSPSQVNALVDFSADLIQDLGNKFRGQINREIQLAALGDKSVHGTMQTITRILYGSNRPPPFTPGLPGFKGRIGGVAYDAERILRTEMNRAHNLAAQSQQTELAQQVPGLRKQWLATGDTRTRLSHLSAHGQVVAVGKPFQVGGASLMFPGDPAGPAHETINCRCRSVTVIPEVEDTSLPIDADIEAEKARRGAEKAAKASDEGGVPTEVDNYLGRETTRGIADLNEAWGTTTDINIDTLGDVEQVAMGGTINGQPTIMLNPRYYGDVNTFNQAIFDTGAAWESTNNSNIRFLERQITSRSALGKDVAKLQNKLNEFKAAKRYSAATDSTNPAYVTSVHESAHAIGKATGKEKIFTTRADRFLSQGAINNLDILGVSEYASVSMEELLAETAAMITSGRRSELPERILRLYDSVFS
jgi:hypothetical protein